MDSTKYLRRILAHFASWSSCTLWTTKSRDKKKNGKSASSQTSNDAHLQMSAFSITINRAITLEARHAIGMIIALKGRQQHGEENDEKDQKGGSHCPCNLVVEPSKCGSFPSLKIHFKSFQHWVSFFQKKHLADHESLSSRDCCPGKWMSAWTKGRPDAPERWSTSAWGSTSSEAGKEPRGSRWTHTRRSTSPGQSSRFKIPEKQRRWPWITWVVFLPGTSWERNRLFVTRWLT